MLLDVTSPAVPPPSEPAGHDLPASLRVEARLNLSVGLEAGRLRITDRHEAGAFRFRMPRRTPDAIEALMVNVAGGLAGGDWLSLAARAGEGASLVIGSAAAERIYRSGGDTTRMSIALVVEPGARLAWVPAETVIHRGARLTREFSLSIAPDARLLAGEMVQLGRVASGERFTAGTWRDRWRVRIGDRLVLAEEFHLEGGQAQAAGNPGGLAGHAFLCTLLLAMPDAGERLPALRAAFTREPGVHAGATSHSGLVFARALSSDDVALRRAFLAALRVAAGADLPLSRLLLLQETSNRGLS
ncbi:MAG: urease accessory protein UreD [Methylobacterium sp.]|jgi:urease accessory protein|nr:urease accessory protein UreD [Methylobacterium sp.]